MKKILGVPLIVVVIGLVVIGGAMAALVGYLSNSVSAEATVDSPLSLEISDDNETWVDSIALGDLYGGQEVEFFARTSNNAGVDIYSYLVLFVEADNVWDGAEIKELWYTDSSNSFGWTYFNVTNRVHHIDETGNLYPLNDLPAGVTTLKLIIADDDNGVWVAVKKPQHPWDKTKGFKVLLHEATAPDNYKIEMCHLYDLEGDCEDPENNE